MASNNLKGRVNMIKNMNIMNTDFVVKPIKNASEHKAAIERINQIWDPAPGSPEADQFEVLCLLIEAYEQKNFKIESTYDPIDAINFWCEQKGYTRKDLEQFIGSRSRVAEILNRKRPLSITMIRNLSEAGIPAQMLVKRIRSLPTHSKTPVSVVKKSKNRSAATHAHC